MRLWIGHLFVLNWIMMASQDHAGYSFNTFLIIDNFFFVKLKAINEVPINVADQ